MSNSEKRLLVALGGNAIKKSDEEGTTSEQFANVETTAQQLGKIIERGKYEIVITHGNGPQAGNLLIQQEQCSQVTEQDLHVIGSMTQGQIGYMIQNRLNNYFSKKDMRKHQVISVINQVKVRKNDPEFEKEIPSKPVGPFYTEEAKNKKREEGWIVKKVKPKEDKRWRRVVPSPEPQENVEARSIKKIIEGGITVIASGGGGIPVVEERGEIRGVNAVIDKDKAGALLAKRINADIFLVLTDVKKAKLNYGEPEEKDIDEMTVEEAEKYIQEGHFLEGSMLPKVKACRRFVKQGGEEAIITNLENAENALRDGEGTHIIS